MCCVLALRNANGSYIVNGDWKFSPSATIEAAGTRFFYKRNDPNTLETVTALGPLINPVDLMVSLSYHFILPFLNNFALDCVSTTKYWN